VSEGEIIGVPGHAPKLSRRSPRVGITVVGMDPLAPTPETLCGLLAEPDRLKVFAAVALGADSPSAVVEQTGLPAKAVTAAVRRLHLGGLVTIEDGAFATSAGTFKDAVRRHTPEAPPEEPLDVDRTRAQVLRTFISDGRLVQIPVARAKRRIVLEHIVASFEPGVRYPERTVNAVLRAWFPDHAALRRYLVDEGLMGRDAGEYWRTGGYVPV
jgi:hypothetical protein